MIAIDPNNPEWYTPSTILDRVYSVLGGVTLDPCCNLYGSPNVIAEKHYRLPIDGLSEPWGFGNTTIFMNPPYGRVIQNWTHKLTYEYNKGGIKSAIALVPVKTDTIWWNDLMNSAACWCAVRGRISFKNPSGKNTQTGTFASAVVLLSDDKSTVYKFVSSFDDIGSIWGRISR
jgi:hypothetical protein